MKHIRYFIEFILVLPLHFFIRLLPHSFLFAFSAVAGRSIFLIPPFRKLLIANIRAAFPEKEIAEVRLIARKSISNLVLTLLEFSWFMDRPDRVEEYISVPQKDRETVRIGREDKNALIVIAPHLGNWEIAGLMIKHFFGLNFAVVARTIRNPYFEKLINSGRMFKGTKVISSKGAVKGMIKALEEGYSMATLIDQNSRVRDGGVFVDFFGLPVPSSRAPAFLFRKANVHMAVGGCIRKGRKYESYSEPLSKQPDEYEDDREIIQELMTITESYVRRYPEQYLWFYKRFQYIPREADEELIKKYPYYARVATERFYSKPVARKKS